MNVTPDEHIDTFERIATLGKRKKRDASPPPPPKRLAWSENQTKLIKDYFKVAIASGTAVTLSEARDFLRVNNIPGRIPKAVQDKVKTIRRQKAIEKSLNLHLQDCVYLRSIVEFPAYYLKYYSVGLTFHLQ